MISRRKLIASGAAAVAGGTLLRNLAAETPATTRPATRPATRPGGPAFKPVITPNGSTLPWEWDGGVKVYRLVAEPVKREFAPGMVVDCWGYNGQTPGPTIEAVEGTGCASSSPTSCPRQRRFTGTD